MGSIPAGNIHKETRHVKKGRQTYMSLLTDMDVFLFYLATPMTENAEHSRLVARANKEAPDCDEEAQRSLSYAWLIIKENI